MVRRFVVSGHASRVHARRSSGEARLRAGSYLDRAALMLDEAHREGDVLLPRTFDKELILVLKFATEARAKVGRQMEVPASVAKAHPHLLLVLENYERAVDYASEGNFKKFVEHLNAARDEELVPSAPSSKRARATRCRKLARRSER